VVLQMHEATFPARGRCTFQEIDFSLPLIVQCHLAMLAIKT